MILIKALGFLLTEILYNGHLQSFGAAGIVYLSSRIVLNRITSFPVFLIIYLTFQFVYFNDRYKCIGLDSKTNLERSKHLRKYYNFIPYLMVFCVILIVSLVLLFSNVLTLVFCLFVMFMGYLYPVYFKLLTKKVYLFKNFYVSSVFSLLTFYPYIHYQIRPEGILIYALFFFVFIESMISQIVLDCKDIESDKNEKYLTLPVILGYEKCRNVLIFLSIANFIIFLATSLNLNFSMQFNLLVFSSLIINSLIIVLLKRKIKIVYLISAGKYLLWLLLLLIIG